MQTREALEARVRDLERELAAVRKGAMRRVRKKATWGLGNIPMYEVALGPDLEQGQMRGHARAIFAVGDIATGFVAVGGWARGVLAFGGLATGVISFGGLSIGLLAAVGGLAIGSVALGGGAVGGVALGGGAVGQYACGGGAIGRHVIRPGRIDPEAEAFFRQKGLMKLCAPPQQAERREVERSEGEP